MVKLVSPDARYEQSYRSYIEELGDEERYPFPLDFEHGDFGELLLKLQRFEQGIDIPDGFVPSTTYWLVENDELLGVSNLRHHLNERIRRAGGHIGLGIRPSRWGEGLGNILLKLTLERAFARGLDPVHIHCHKANLASVRMIVANGGTLDSEIREAGDVVQRYLVAP